MIDTTKEPVELESYVFRVHHLHDFLQDRSLLDQWDRLIDTSGNINAFYASSAWLAHQANVEKGPARIWCVHDLAGALRGGVAVRLKSFRLKFSIASRTLFEHSTKAAHILGSVPSLPETHPLVVEWIRRVFEDWPECQAIYSDACPTDSSFYACLEHSIRHHREFFHYRVDGPRPWHLLDLDASFDEYLESLSSKARSAFRRKARLATQESHGAASVCCVTAPHDVAGFLREAVSVSQESWQHKILGMRVACDDDSVRAFSDAASRGLLRCYLLKFGTRPSAFVIGYQYAGIYHYAELGFREDLSEHSPGTVLLYHIIEDLHRNSPPFKLINFGVGDATYKRRYGNRTLTDTSSLVLRRTVRNKLMTAKFGILEKILSTTKKIVGRRVTK
jgi:Acetyltransferase (GNAT) domain